MTLGLCFHHDLLSAWEESDLEGKCLYMLKFLLSLNFDIKVISTIFSDSLGNCSFSSLVHFVIFEKYAS